MANVLEDVKMGIKNNIIYAIDECIEAGDFNILDLPEIELEVPRDKSHGDFSTNIAMQLPKQAKKPPREIAQLIVDKINSSKNYISKIDIAGPGFINFKLSNNWLYKVLEDIDESMSDYGKVTVGKGKSVNVEYISANPTGPMHMGNARGGAIGDVLASVFEWAGYKVTREFYINDAGNQIEKFGQSLEARYLQLLGEEVDFPEDGYQGEDITNHMRDFIQLEGNKYLNINSQDRKKVMVEYALEKNIKNIKEDLKKYGIKYDVWFSEKTLHKSNEVIKSIELLEEKGFAYKKDGAVWFKATEFGCEKDDVLVRQNGIPTYFAADIAYHLNKLKTREFDWSINVWGADHHGHIARLKAAIQAMGINPERLDIIVMQLVRLMRQGEVARMSKRKGKMITLSDLVEEVGLDAARFFFNMRSPDSHLDFDLDLAVEQSNENPVFYVQYAHARICSIIRQMEKKCYNLDISKVNLTMLTEKEELQLIRKLADLPYEITLAANKMDPSRITKYAIELSGLFHSFYNACRVRVEDIELMKARVILIQCTLQVLKNVLIILGINAPDKM